MKFLSKITGVLLLFTLSLPQAWAFSDVSSGSWYESSVLELEKQGIVDSADLFNPEKELNRVELVKMVILALGGLEDSPLPSAPSFLDVPLNQWFGPYVEKASALKVITGYKNEDGTLTGYFKPENSVTRAEAVQVLVKAFKLTNDPQTQISFPDVEQEDWFYNSVDVAFDHGLVKGYEDGLFKPHQAVTRAEMAKMLAKLIENTSTQTPQQPEVIPVEPGVIPTQPELVVKELFVPSSVDLKPRIIPDGQMQLMASYGFEGIKEGFYIQTLTVVNDTTGSSLGDNPEGSFAIKNITLKYPDKDGLLKTATSSLSSNGTAHFSGLDFFAKSNTQTPLEIYAQINSFADIGAQLSGEMLRVGLQEVNNTIETFKAVGEFSGSINTGTSSLFANHKVDEVIVRKVSTPSIKNIRPNGNLFNGENELTELEFKLSKGSMGLGRLVFQISLNDSDGTDLNLSEFKLWQGADIVNNVVIYDATGGQDLSVGSLSNGTSKVIVSFNKEEVISYNDTGGNYSLRATVNGSKSGDSVVTQILGDLNQSLSGLTAVNQENTGKLYVNGDATAGIFTSASDFSQTVGVNRNIIWSDKSAQPHQYATVNNGTIITDTGSADWMNGYLWDMSELDSSVLSK